MKEIKIDMKYGFPLFAKPDSLVNLGKNEKLVISDIWAFWDYVVKKASKNQTGEQFLRSLLEQAKHFYHSAEDSPVKSQPLLYYYSFLNLAKIMINLTGTFGRDKRYMHGMTNPQNQRFLYSEIVKERQKTSVVQVAHELVSLFDPSITQCNLTLNVKDLLNHCVGVHRAYCEIYSQPEIFVRFKSHNLYKQGKTLTFKAFLYCTPKQKDSLTTQGYNITSDSEGIYYVESITMDGYTPKRADYAALSSAIRAKGVWYFIGNNGYTMYLSSNPNMRYSQESIIYMMMFYLGSITRYHPYLFDEIFSDKEQWLMSEFLTTQPKQFLYLATANVLGQSVLKAYASF